MAGGDNAAFDAEALEAEARERWGDTPAFRESERRTRTYGPAQWAEIRAEADAIMADLAQLMHAGRSGDDADAMAAAERHRRHIDRWFYPCSHRMHAGLAELYVTDDRFGAYFEERGAGLAAFVAAAIRANAARAAA